MHKHLPSEVIIAFIAFIAGKVSGLEKKKNSNVLLSTASARAEGCKNIPKKGMIYRTSGGKPLAAVCKVKAICLPLMNLN